MTEHTQGPLHVGGDGTIIYDKDGWGVASATVFHGRQEPGTAQGNARRIVAALNACDGISTELLEQGGESRIASWGESISARLTVERQLAAVEKQRDALLAALERAQGMARRALSQIGDIRHGQNVTSIELWAACEHLENLIGAQHAAIAAAKAGAK